MGEAAGEEVAGLGLADAPCPQVEERVFLEALPVEALRQGLGEALEASLSAATGSTVS